MEMWRIRNSFALLLGLVALLGSCGGDKDNNNGRSGPLLPNENAGLVVDAGASQVVRLGSLVTLNGMASAVSGGAVLGYQWSFASKPPQSAAVLSSPSSPTTSFVADQLGTYTVQLVVLQAPNITTRDLVTIEVNSSGESAATFNHSGLSATCVSCHNGASSRGKSGGHPATTDLCDACHSTQQFRPVTKVDHNEVFGSCESCHNGQIALGKPVNHVPTNSDCSQCHTASTWRTTGLGSGGFSVRHEGDDSEGRGSAIGGRASGDDDDDEFDDDDGLGGSSDFNHANIGATPCQTCHNGITAEGKPRDHIATTADCGLCHNTRDWEDGAAGGGGLTGNHIPIPAGMVCSTCHNGVAARGKSVSHIATAAECNVCHSTNGWRPANGGGTGTVPIVGQNHIPIPAGTLCSACHNGISARGKSVTHIATNSDCSFCHTTIGWVPANGGGITNPINPVNPINPINPINPVFPTPGLTFDHSTIGLTSCVTCHNGVNARGKSISHIATSSLCDRCHTTTVWQPVLFVDHNEVLGLCTTCHNGISATGKPANHPQTNSECNFCHSAAGWLPVR